MNPEELGKVLLHIQKEMYPCETLESAMGNLWYTMARIGRMPTGTLMLLKERVISDWESVWVSIRDGLIATRHLSPSEHSGSYMEELYMFFHLYRIHSPDRFQRDYTSPRYWSRMPPVISITLMVPPAKWRHLNIDDQSLQCAVEEVGRKVGSSCLLIPTWTLLEDPETAKIEFGTGPSSLGDPEVIYKVNLHDQEHVYVTSNLPNGDGTLRLRGYTKLPAPPVAAEDQLVLTTVHVGTTARPEAVFLNKFTAKANILSSSLRDALERGGEVKVIPLPPCTFSITIGHENPFLVSFTAPAIARTMKARPSFGTITGFTWPMHFFNTGTGTFAPHLWVAPYLSLPKLPIVDISKFNREFLTWYPMALTTSCREKQAHRGSRITIIGSLQQPAHCFADKLVHVPNVFPRVPADRSNVFGISTGEPTASLHMLFLVSALRLDLANGGVVLDAAVLPLESHSYQRRKGIMRQNVDLEELEM
ncbi:hypothetical protein QBC38DRAFT_500479 [Podospora fimiseda]|uniref:Uncharacterized protein n=1 Tax=Podospora fimiseda TaxID=252190 RepID=A0AAN7BMX7_9PEZI|nr:hypothetical protein QBC38DRAFT_500479 [Podospora fimiseda]